MQSESSLVLYTNLIVSSCMEPISISFCYTEVLEHKKGHHASLFIPLLKKKKKLLNICALRTVGIFHSEYQGLQLHHIWPFLGICVANNVDNACGNRPKWVRINRMC